MKDEPVLTILLLTILAALFIIMGTLIGEEINDAHIEKFCKQNGYADMQEYKIDDVWVRYCINPDTQEIVPFYDLLEQE